MSLATSARSVRLVACAAIAAASSALAHDAVASYEDAPVQTEDHEYRYAAQDVVTVGVPIDGSTLVRGRSTILVRAPLPKVRASVLGFSRYAEFMPHHRACRVLGRTSTGGKDVYVEVTALRGAMQMWARFEMQKARMENDVEVHQTRFLEGNVKDFSATWRLKKIDAATTELTLEVFLQPKLPLPAAVLNKENLSGSAQGVVAMRNRIERG